MLLDALTSAEISLPATPDASQVRDRIAVLSRHVDLVGLTDNHAGKPRMSPLAAVALARERGRVAGELQVALDSRVVIEQAKGVLVGRHGLTTRQAFERLRRQARDQRRPLTEVARAVVSAAEHR